MFEPVKSTDELMTHIEALEQRVVRLETERDRLRADTARLLPQTNLLSPNFLTRAFAVWGHYFVAQLLISVIFLISYCLIMAFFGGLAGVLSNLGN